MTPLLGRAALEAGRARRSKYPAAQAFRRPPRSSFPPPGEGLTLRPMKAGHGCSCVLVVEDDADARDALARFVQRLGHEVYTAATASEALACILLNQPDRVLLDLMLPGTNGLEVLRMIRSHRWPLRVAIATAVHDPLEFGDVRELHADAIFRKPLDLPLIKHWLLEA